MSLGLTGDLGGSGIGQALHGTYLIGLNGTAGQLHAMIVDEFPAVSGDSGQVTAGQTATFTADGNGLDPGDDGDAGEIGLDIYDPGGNPVYWGYIDDISEYSVEFTVSPPPGAAVGVYTAYLDLCGLSFFGDDPEEGEGDCEAGPVEFEVEAEPACAPSVTITNRPIHITALLSSPWQYTATLTSIASPSGGTYSWSTNNPSMVTFLSGQYTNQVTLGIISTNGEATITLTYMSPCGVNASDSFTFALTNDTTVVAWVQPVPVVDPPNLPNGSPDPVWTELVGQGPQGCSDTLIFWSDQGQAGFGVGNNGLTSAEIAFVNEFLINGTANPPPPTQFQEDQSSFLNSNQYRLYQRFQGYWELQPNGGISQPPVALESWVAVGVTPEPCSGFQIQIFSLPVQTNAINGESGLTPNGLWMYQVNEARIGSDGQGVNQFLNGPAGADYTTTTPWIWSVIQFDANGYTQAFSQNSTNSTTQNLGSFPAYWIYTNGYLDPSYQINQSGLMTFISLNSSFQYGGPQ